MLAPAAAVHVPAQHLEPEASSGPDDPAKDDPLRPAWAWDSEWPKPGYVIIYGQDGATQGPDQALFAGSRGAGGVPLSLLCLPTTAPAPQVLPRVPVVPQVTLEIKAQRHPPRHNSDPP